MTPSTSGFEASNSRDIHDATIRCISSFEACLSVKSLMKEGWAESRLADMKLWASGVGALAGPDASLDRRLEFQPKPRFVLKSLLLTLQELIKRCQDHALTENRGGGLGSMPESEDPLASPVEKVLEPALNDDSDQGPSSVFWFIELGNDINSASDASSDSHIESEPVEQYDEPIFREEMRNIEDILDQLIMLGFAIRKSGTAARLQKADMSFNVEDNKDLREHLVFILVNDAAKMRKGGEDNRTITVENRLQESKGHFDNLTPEQQHLVLANLRRRHRFSYARRHHLKLDQPMGQTSMISPKPTVTEQHRGGSIRDPLLRTSKTAELSATAPSAAKGDILKMAIPSQAAASRVSVSAAKMHYPTAPLVQKQMKGFKCPCCYQTLPRMFKESDLRWRKHLIEDLCPYTCPFLDCPREKVLYISRASWYDHILESHGAGLYWECLICVGTGTSNTFLTAEEFTLHNQEKHKDAISEDQIIYMQKSCRKIAPPNIPQCPLCSWPQDEEVEPDAAMNLEHVGNCIHEFSLKAFPWAESLPLEGAGMVESVRDHVESWLDRITGETIDHEEIQKIDITSFRFIPSPFIPIDQGTRYYPKEYFAESIKSASQVEPGSLSQDLDLSQDFNISQDIALFLASSTKNNPNPELPYRHIYNNLKPGSGDQYNGRIYEFNEDVTGLT
ncbi:hypothetical protein F53441_2725 [Fusarium austroafricanum]|uniref:C2H2-type domain-containing protein n=1 Tax=Fusarium austroafricanum TaxID=2364996 RepID=A0A8H4KP32_9HYPO|nr:hypothetical protein F53441_2725 [Fusarium austroafricanum]